MTADAGYGSEENYLYLKKKGIEAYVKYNSFDLSKKQRKRQQKYPFTAERLYYDAEQNRLICPMGQTMNYIGTRRKKNKSGFVQQLSRYQARNCTGCPIRGRCHKTKENRVVEINFSARSLRAESKARLESEKGSENRKQRAVDVEPVFAHIKHNRNFRRFHLRGKQKVEVEMGLIAIAHNLLKASA